MSTHDAKAGEEGDMTKFARGKNFYYIRFDFRMSIKGSDANMIVKH